MYLMEKVEIGIYFCVNADILTKDLLKYFWSYYCSPLPNICILSKSLILTGSRMATGRPNFRKKKKKKKHTHTHKLSKIFFSEAIWGMKLKLCIHVHDSSLCINFVLYCCLTCAFVNIATWRLDRLIMGNVEIGIYFCVTADILTKVVQKCSWSSSLPIILTVSKSLILIGGHGNRKAKFSK